MSESLFVDYGGMEIQEDFQTLAPVPELEEQPAYCRERLMATDLVAVRGTIEYAREYHQLPSPHSAYRECTKAATVVASALDYIRHGDEGFGEASPFVIPSVEQAATAMRKVFGGKLEEMEKLETHPVSQFFNSLNGVRYLGRPTITLKRVTPERFEGMQRFIRQWEAEEDDRIMQAVRRNMGRTGLAAVDSVEK